MSNIKAFPLHEDQTETRDMEQRGMDLRDYFAAKAIQGMLAEGYVPEHGVDFKSYQGRLHVMYAEQAYKIADAMLEARKS